MSHIVSCHTRPQSCAVHKKNAQNSTHAELQFSVLHVKVFYWLTRCLDKYKNFN